MKQITFSPTFDKKVGEIKKKDDRLFKKIRKCIKQFRTDPHYPALRRHKLSGDLSETWSLSVTMSIRILFVEDDVYYFFDIGTHDQVYKK
jgi:addiction module RelE/StbE family toxin